MPWNSIFRFSRSTSCHNFPFLRPANCWVSNNYRREIDRPTSLLFDSTMVGLITVDDGAMTESSTELHDMTERTLLQLITKKTGTGRELGRSC